MYVIALYIDKSIYELIDSSENSRSISETHEDYIMHMTNVRWLLDRSKKN